MSSLSSPYEAMRVVRTATNQRTTLWGVENQTQDSIEISFGQLTSVYNLPGYTTDTGTKLIIQNGAPGQSAVRDPLVDTGGVPIAATYFDFTVKIVETNQDLQGTQQAPEGDYFVQAIYTIVYEDGVRPTDTKKTYKLKAEYKYAKLRK